MEPGREKGRNEMIRDQPGEVVIQHKNSNEQDIMWIDGCMKTEKSQK